MNILHEPYTTGLFTLVGVLVGLIGSHALTVLRDRRLEARQKEALGRAISVEVIWLCQQVRSSTGLLNKWFSEKTSPTLSVARLFRPSAHEVFSANVGRIHVFPPRLAEALVSFYVGLSDVERHIDEFVSNESPDRVRLSSTALELYRDRWRRTAEMGAKLLSELTQAFGYQDHEFVKDLENQLRKVSKGEYSGHLASGITKDFVLHTRLDNKL